MAMGRKARERQGEFWVATQLLPGTPRHVFYEKLNGILAAGGFDRFVEDLCEPYYAETLGRESIPPGHATGKLAFARAISSGQPPSAP